MRPCLFITLVSMPMLQGCYTYTPLQTAAPAIGETVQFQISDRGRVALGETMGSGVSSIEARITGATEDQFLIKVAGVVHMSGEKSTWSGESVRLNRDFVERVQLRKLSKSRSWVAAIGVSVAIGTFIATRGLLGFNTGDRSDPIPDPPGSFRFPIRFQF